MSCQGTCRSRVASADARRGLLRNTLGAEPLPGFGGATPDALVREGKADHVHACLDRIMAGGHA